MGHVLRVHTRCIQHCSMCIHVHPALLNVLRGHTADAPSTAPTVDGAAAASEPPCEQSWVPWCHALCQDAMGFGALNPEP